MNKEVVSKNLRQIIVKLDIYDYEFADMCKMNRTVLSYALMGKKAITLTQLYKIIKAFPLINLNWLIKDEGQMFNKPVQKSVTKKVTKLLPTNLKTPVKSNPK